MVLIASPICCRAAPAAAAAERDLALGVRKLLLERLSLLDERLEALDQIFGPRPQNAGGFLDALILLGEIGARAFARQRFDAPDAGSRLPLRRRP